MGMFLMVVGVVYLVAGVILCMTVVGAVAGGPMIATAPVIFGVGALLRKG